MRIVRNDILVVQIGVNFHGTINITLCYALMSDTVGFVPYKLIISGENSFRRYFEDAPCAHLVFMES